MSERSFFDKRDAIPGYTFILYFLVINYHPLIYYIREPKIDSLFGTVLAFAMLFSGSAIGFLISQFWWWWYHRQGGMYKLVPAFQTLINEYHLTRDTNLEGMKRVISVWGYFFHKELSNCKKVELVRYTTRRWDLFHLSSATMTASGIGVALGTIFRIIFHYCKNITFICEREMVVLIPSYLSFAILLIVMWSGRNWILRQYSDISKTIILDSDIKESHLRKVFPENYFYIQSKNE